MQSSPAVANRSDHGENADARITPLCSCIGHPSCSDVRRPRRSTEARTGSVVLGSHPVRRPAATASSAHRVFRRSPRISHPAPSLQMRSRVSMIEPLLTSALPRSPHPPAPPAHRQRQEPISSARRLYLLFDRLKVNDTYLLGDSRSFASGSCNPPRNLTGLRGQPTTASYRFLSRLGSTGSDLQRRNF